jgi:hypothetical protein
MDCCRLDACSTLSAVHDAIEADCKGLLQPMELPYDGVAWLCPWSQMIEALPGLFLARRPELAFLAFDSHPDIRDVMAASKSADALLPHVSCFSRMANWLRSERMRTAADNRNPVRQVCVPI